MKMKPGRPSRAPAVRTAVVGVSQHKSLAMGGSTAAVKKGSSAQVGAKFQKVGKK